MSSQSNRHLPFIRGISRCVHSRYLRRPSDLSLGGHRVSLHLTMRHFHYDAVLCGQQIFAERLMLPVSNDTLLHVVRRRARIPHKPPSVADIGDVAWRRNHRYGTVVVDLEQWRPIVLLPDRDTATSQA